MDYTDLREVIIRRVSTIRGEIVTNRITKIEMIAAFELWQRGGSKI